MNPWSKALWRTAWISGGFSVLVLIGLIANAIAVRSADPNPPTRLDALVTRLNQDRQNEKLREDIRHQDVWLRETYLRSERFASMGFLLLLGGLSACLLCFKGARAIGASGPDPAPHAPTNALAGYLVSQRSLLATGICLGGGLLAVAVLSRHDAANAYVIDSRLPSASPGAKRSEPGGPDAPPIAALPQLGAAAPPIGSAIPGALQGSIPPIAAPAPGGTSVQPLPVSPPAASGSTPPKAGTTPPPADGISPVTAMAGAWPWFRGSGAGLAYGALPGAWDAASGKGVVWKTEVPLPGWGSPVLWGGKIFLSGADAKTREVFAFDAKDGHLLWRAPVSILNKDFKSSKDAGQAPGTMTVDAQYVAAAFVNGDVAVFDHSGKRLWSRTFGPMDNEYGYASCPVLVGGKLLLQLDQGSSPDDGKSKLIAMNPSNGKALWEVKRPVSSAWSTPIVAQVSGRAVVVVCGNPLVMAYDLSNGKEVWRADGMGGEVAPSAAFGAGCVFVAQAGGQSMALRASDGKAVWANYELALPDISSPVFADGLLFFCSSDGTLTAVDAKTGKSIWEHAMGKPARSSPLVAGDKLLIFGTDGVGRVAEVGRAYKLLGSYALGEAVWASPALVDGKLYIRTERRLYCLGDK